MAMGARIAEIRGDKDQAQLAKKAGMSQQAWSNLETRDSKTSEWAPAIADVLGVSLRWLLTGEGDKQSDWPFVKVTRSQLFALDEVDRLIVEGQLIQALQALRPHKPGKLPIGVVVIPERREQSTRRVSKLPRDSDAAPQRRGTDKKSAKGG